MEFWLAWFHESNSGEDVKAVARAAEEMGYTGVALSDHVALPKVQKSRHPILGIPYDPATPNIEPITTAATMAAVTENLRFMTYAYVMGMRDPFTVAKQTASLADLSGNRFALGITPGWNTDEIALLGHDPATRGKRFVESIDIIQGLWGNDLFSYNGEYYQFRDVGLAPRPEIAPKIYIGGNSLVAIRRAANNAGWIGMNHPLEGLELLLTQLDDLSEGRAEKYVVAQELSEDYLARLQMLGVKGVVLMPWALMTPASEPLEAKLEAMRALVDRWPPGGTAG